MDYALSLNYSEISDHVDHIYSTEIEIAMCASYIELQIETDNENWLRKKLLRDDFSFSIVYFPLICSSIPIALVYVYHNEYI